MLKRENNLLLASLSLDLTTEIGSIIFDSTDINLKRTLRIENKL